MTLSFFNLRSNFFEKLSCLKIGLTFLLGFQCISSLAQLRIFDDAGHIVSLPHPAKRIVTLSPHLTELVFAAGAGQYVVATSIASNWPPEARHLPQISDHRGIDFERLVMLKPDLVLLWKSSAVTNSVARIQALGIPVWINEPSSFEDIADSIERIGKLANTMPVAQQAADTLRKKTYLLKKNNRLVKKEIRVFFQAWPRPLMTLNKQHFISYIIKLCGGKNIFANTQLSTPIVSLEAVIKLDPEIILTTYVTGNSPDFSIWQSIPQLSANKINGLLAINADLLTRPTPRSIEAAQQICQAIDHIVAVRDKSKN